MRGRFSVFTIIDDGEYMRSIVKMSTSCHITLE